MLSWCIECAGETSATLWSCCVCSHYIQSLSGSVYSTLQITNNVIHYTAGIRSILSKPDQKECHQPLGLWCKIRILSAKQRSPFRDIYCWWKGRCGQVREGWKELCIQSIRCRNALYGFAWPYMALKSKPKAMSWAIKSQNSHDSWSMKCCGVG